MASVAVVIVNYNRAAMLVDCVESVLGQSVAPAEVVVVDNGSGDGSAEAVEERFGGRVTVVRLPENRGFAGGNNAGVAAARSEWIALINNDATADRRWLEAMLRRAGDGTGMVACRVLRADRRDLLDNLGVSLWPDGMSRGLAHFERDAEALGPALLPSGCAMLIRRRAFEEAGGFDESFFCYSEDTDLFLKVRLLGYGVEFAPDAWVYHRSGGGTLGEISPAKVYLVERNRFHVLFRYYPWGWVVVSPWFTLLRYLGLAAAMRGSGSGGGGLAGLQALVRAWAHGLRGLPQDLRLRRTWLGDRSLGKARMAQWIRRRRLDWRSLNALEPS